MKTAISLSNRLFWFDLGWYSGEPFALLKIQILKIEHCVITIFQIQFLKFFIGIGR
jgi:hypothetical protein